jgi:creatinine amidohydrolase
MNEEVRFYYMIPDQLIERREETPIAYLPVGALEWHGSHLPFGTDCMTVEHMAIHAARRVGGVVFPPMTYGDCRYRLHDVRPEWISTCQKRLKINPENGGIFTYGQPGPNDYVADEDDEFKPLPMTHDEQMESLTRHIAYTMLEIALYGFKGIVVMPGHGPVTGPCDQALSIFQENAECLKRLRPIPKTEMFAYLIAAREIEPALTKHWVHADKIESSLLQCLQPEVVHPDKLPASQDDIPDAYVGGEYLHPDTGYNPEHRDIWDSLDAMDPREMNPAYGQKILEFSVGKLSECVLQMKESIAN